MRAMLWAVWLAATAATVAHALRPDGLVVHSPASVPVVETVVLCAMALLAALFLGRWRERGLLVDLGTCFALTVLVAAKLVFSVVPLARGGAVAPQIKVAALLAGVVAAGILAAVALLPDRRVAFHRAALLGLTVGVVVVVAVVRVVAAAHTDTFVGIAGPPSTDAIEQNGPAAVTLVHLVTALGFCIASMRFARRERLAGDPFYGWLAVTVALLALARVNYAWTPARVAADLTVGDWLRLSGCAVGVVAASSEFLSYWRRLAEVAVLQERRRLARDMHDGIAQELAFIATQARALARSSPDPRAEMLQHAADRALDESRRGIAALTRPVDEPLDVALAQQAEELSGRLGVRVLLDLQPVRGVNGETREALLRIAREAITNAGRHARPTRITVSLLGTPGVTLRVTDDGRGFRVDDPRVFAGGRYGVTGMRERAEALGGRLRLESRPFVGTKVEVHVP